MTEAERRDQTLTIVAGCLAIPLALLLIVLGSIVTYTTWPEASKYQVAFDTAGEDCYGDVWLTIDEETGEELACGLPTFSNPGKYQKKVLQLADKLLDDDHLSQADKEEIEQLVRHIAAERGDPHESLSPIGEAGRTALGIGIVMLVVAVVIANRFGDETPGTR